MKTVIHVVGARPNFIKAAPLIKKMNELSDVENVILLMFESLQKIKNNHDFRYLK